MLASRCSLINRILKCRQISMCTDIPGIPKFRHARIGTIVEYTRNSACVPAVAGTHAPGKGEGVVGSRRWLGDIITAQLAVVVGVRVKHNAKWWKR